VIEEETEAEAAGKEDVGRVEEDHTPLASALLRPRMLQLRAAYSLQSNRRDRLAFLRQHAVVGGANAQVHGERLHMDEPPVLRRHRLRPEPRPPTVMGIRASDRTAEELSVIEGLVPAGTVLLQPRPEEESASVSEDLNNDDDDDDDDALRIPSRALNDWTGLTHTSSPTMSPSPHH